jgi:hypothetical protein
MECNYDRLSRIARAAEAELGLRDLRDHMPAPVFVDIDGDAVLVMVDRHGHIGIVGRYRTQNRAAILDGARPLQLYALALREAIALRDRLKVGAA